MIDYAEKRDFLRMPIDCELTFTVSGSGRQYQGSVINLSSKGILFTSSEKFDPGTSLDIILTPSNSLTPPMQATVVVSRVISNDVLFEVGCEITEIKS
ncbi:MAG: PilZ domain-containing protein [Gammaproteobacteria bacterium]|nr:PilZ domain-containing protein [Gammaproteobacteria bacterium]MDH3449835.1 PilZ domain-containing protein [Gammaproteobacteria bacterium]